MRICLVSREYPTDDHAGGIGTLIEKTARGLVRLGQEVDVITEAVDAPSTRAEEGVTVHRLASTAPRGALKVPHTRALRRSLAVARAVVGLPQVPDIVQACENGAEGFWYSLRRHRSTTLVTLLATPDAVVAELNAHSGVQPLQVKVMEWLERTQTRRSDVVISTSDALADIVAPRWGLPRDSVASVPTGVDFAERYAKYAGEVPDELRGVEYAIYVGRLEERKGVHLLGEALPQVLAAHPELHFVFAGSNYMTYNGESMQAFIERCTHEHRARLHFLPRQPHSRLYPLYANALFAVFPSLWESVPNVAVEALDAGRPVVATLGCGFGEVVEDGRSGVLVPPGDADALRAALLSLLGDRDRLQRMAEGARARARCFSLDRAVEPLLDVYERSRARAEAVTS